MRMMAALSSAVDFLQGHGWAKFGVVMRKGEHQIVLTFDQGIMVASNTKDADVPPEVHKLVGKRRDH